MGEKNLEYARRFKTALIDYGLNELQISLLLTQATVESARFKSPHALTDNNFAGVKYQTTFGNAVVPSKVYFAPGDEDRYGRRIPYAHFNSIVDFIGRWIPKSHLNEMIMDNNIGIPVNAPTLEEYAHRLKLNHYYQKTEAEYLAALKTVASELQKAGLIPEFRPVSNPAMQIVSDLVYLNENAGGLLIKLNLNAKAIHDLPEFANHDWWDFMEFGRSALEAGDGNMLANPIENRVVEVHSTALTPPDMIRKSRNIAAASTVLGFEGWPLALGALEAGKMAAQVILRSKSGKNKSSENKGKQLNMPKKGRKKTASSLNLPDAFLLSSEVVANFSHYENPWAVPDYLNGNFSSSGFPNSLTDIGNIVSAADSIFSPDYTQSVNNKFEPIRDKTTASPKLLRIGQSKRALQSGNSPTHSSGQAIVINLNKPMIENFTINTSGGNGGIGEFKRKVENVLLEILDSANAMQ